MRRSEKIFHDLTESVEFVELLQSRFYFSSSFNKERFLKGYEDYIKEEEDNIKKWEDQKAAKQIAQMEAKGQILSEEKKKRIRSLYDSRNE